MSTTYVVTSEPTSEPLTLEQFKDSLRVSGCDFDEQLSELLKACRKQVEQDSGRKLVTQTVVMYLDDFPPCDVLQIRMSPVQSITHVKYYDTDGTLQTLSSDSYWANVISVPPQIELRSGYSWPLVQQQRPNVVQVTMVCGYGAASAVDQTAKLAIKELAKSRWSQCESGTAMYDRLISALCWTRYGVAQA